MIFLCNSSICHPSYVRRMCNIKSPVRRQQEATTEAAQQAKATPVKLNASEYVKLGQYKGLTIKGASTKVTDQDVEDQVNELAQDNASYEEIKDRKTVQKDDYLNVDYTTTINGKENSRLFRQQSRYASWRWQLKC